MILAAADKDTLLDQAPFVIEHHEFALDGILELEVFGRELGRTYCVQWDGWTMAMVEHWFDCDARSTLDLDPFEVRKLELWIKRAREVDDLFGERCDEMRNAGYEDDF